MRIGHVGRAGVLSGLLLLVSPPVGSADECVMVAPAGVSAQRIGVVDVERVVEMSKAALAVGVRRQQELDRLFDEMNRGDWILGMAAPTRRRWQRPRLGFPERLPLNDPAFVEIRDEVRALIGRLGVERGYDLILDRRGVGALHVAREHDLTDEVLRLYDRQTSSTALFRSKPLRP
jgi:hypothetical protein